MLVIEWFDKYFTRNVWYAGQTITKWNSSSTSPLLQTLHTRMDQSVIIEMYWGAWGDLSFTRASIV
jgi:hypothetical protein